LAAPAANFTTQRVEAWPVAAIFQVAAGIWCLPITLR